MAHATCAFHHGTRSASAFHSARFGTRDLPLVIAPPPFGVATPLPSVASLAASPLRGITLFWGLDAVCQRVSGFGPQCVPFFPGGRADGYGSLLVITSLDGAERAQHVQLEASSVEIERDLVGLTYGRSTKASFVLCAACVL